MKFAASLTYCAIAIILSFASCKKDDVRECPTQLARITDGKGDMIVKYQYDDNGLLLKTIYPNTDVSEYFYESGLVTHIQLRVNNDVKHVYYTYDEKNRKTSSTTKDATGRVEYVTHFLYRYRSRIVLTLDQNSDTVVYATQSLDEDGIVTNNTQYDVHDSMKVLSTTSYTYDEGKRYVYAFVNPNAAAEYKNFLKDETENLEFHISSETIWEYRYNGQGYPISRMLVSPRDPQTDSSNFYTFYTYGCD